MADTVTPTADQVSCNCEYHQQETRKRMPDAASRWFWVCPVHGRQWFDPDRVGWPNADTPPLEQVVTGIVEERIPGATVTRLSATQQPDGAWMAWYRLPMGESGAVSIPGHVVAPHL